MGVEGKVSCNEDKVPTPRARYVAPKIGEAHQGHGSKDDDSNWPQTRTARAYTGWWAI